jgi:hypothetical protein
MGSSDDLLLELKLFNAMVGFVLYGWKSQDHTNTKVDTRPDSNSVVA